MKLVLTIAVAACLAILFHPAHATNNKPPPAPAPPPHSSSSSQSAAMSQASAAGYATGGDASGGAGGSGQASSNFNDNSRGGGFYVLPAAGAAAPLPGTICPKGDSQAWGIGWNFFWTSTSSTRTELECLDRMLEIMRAQRTPAVEPRLPALAPGDPVLAPSIKKAKAVPLCPKGQKNVQQCQRA